MGAFAVQLGAHADPQSRCCSPGLYWRFSSSVKKSGLHFLLFVLLLILLLSLLVIAFDYYLL